MGCPPKVRLLLRREIAGVFLCSEHFVPILDRAPDAPGDPRWRCGAEKSGPESHLKCRNGKKVRQEDGAGPGIGSEASPKLPERGKR